MGCSKEKGLQALLPARKLRIDTHKVIHLLPCHFIFGHDIFHGIPLLYLVMLVPFTLSQQPVDFFSFIQPHIPESLKWQFTSSEIVLSNIQRQTIHFGSLGNGYIFIHMNIGLSHFGRCRRFWESRRRLSEAYTVLEKLIQRIFSKELCSRQHEGLENPLLYISIYGGAAEREVFADILDPHDIFDSKRTFLSLRILPA